jgi:hypothetical protein
VLLWEVSGDFNVEIDGEILARVERNGNHVQNRRRRHVESSF